MGYGVGAVKRQKAHPFGSVEGRFEAWQTRERIAREYQLAKYYEGNGGNWGVDGGFEGVSGVRRSEE